MSLITVNIPKEWTPTLIQAVGIAAQVSGTDLRSLREHVGWSRDDLAAETGLTGAEIRKAEDGTPSLDVVARAIPALEDAWKHNTGAPRTPEPDPEGD